MISDIVRNVICAGSIPPELAELQYIQHLVLGYNLLTGKLPLEGRHSSEPPMSYGV